MPIFPSLLSLVSYRSRPLRCCARPLFATAACGPRFAARCSQPLAAVGEPQAVGHGPRPRLPPTTCCSHHIARIHTKDSLHKSIEPRWRFATAARSRDSRAASRSLPLAGGRSHSAAALSRPLAYSLRGMALTCYPQARERCVEHVTEQKLCWHCWAQELCRRLRPQTATQLP
jgi:hypothetical protein